MAETTRDRIYRLLEQSRLRKKNVRELSRVSGVKPGTLYNAMSKNARFSKPIAEKLAAALDVTVEEVCTDPADYVRRVPPKISPKARQDAAAEARDKQSNPTLCWECARAVPDEKVGGCEWSDSRGLTPVPGWTATPSPKRRSFHVVSCPKFLPDGAKG